MNELLKVDNLSAGYGKSVIIQEISMFVERGEMIGIIGPNGSGKSTLIKSIFGLSNLFAGRVILDGLEITGFRPYKMVRHGIAYVPQLDNIFPALTVEENLEMGNVPSGKNLKARETIDALLEFFLPLRQRIKQKASVLSGGERQMLAIARALVPKPRLVLLDEPAASLSPKVSSEIFAILKEINSTGTTIVIVEQNVKRVLSMTGRAYVLVSGRMILDEASPTLLKMNLGEVFLGRLTQKAT